MRATALVVGFAAAASGWAVAQPAGPPGPAAERAEVGQDAFDPASVPLVEVIGAREDGQTIMGVVVAPGQVLLSPGDQWTPGARMHCAGTGEEGAVTRVLNWGGRGVIEWAVLEIEWPDGAGPAPMVVAEEDANAGEALRVVSWRNGEYTVLERWVELAFCPHCTHHLRTSTDDAMIEQCRLGSPMLNEHGKLVGILYAVGFHPGAGLVRSGMYAGFIPRNRWQVESVEPVTEERFSEVLRDQKPARMALAAAGEAFRNGAWPEALAGAREAIALDPNLGKAWLTLGYAAYQLENYRIAATALSNALRRDEEPAQATGVLANTVAVLGDRDQAAQLALRIEKAWADDVRALGAAAIALTTVGRDDDARRLLRRVLELNPDNEQASRMLRALDAAEEPERG